LRLNAAVLVRPLSNRGAKSGEEGKEDGYEEETCASRIHKADVKELRAHSKAKTPVAKIAKLTKRSEGSLRQKALKLGILPGHQR
jgi:hypothetical protein